MRGFGLSRGLASPSIEYSMPSLDSIKIVRKEVRSEEYLSSIHQQFFLRISYLDKQDEPARKVVSGQLIWADIILSEL